VKTRACAAAANKNKHHLRRTGDGRTDVQAHRDGGRRSISAVEWWWWWWCDVRQMTAAEE